MVEMKHFIEELMSKTKGKSNKIINQSNTNSNNNNTQNNTNINANFTLNSYGKENIDFLKGDMIELMRNFSNGSISKMIGDIHLNEEYPENHNVYIPSISRDTVAVYEDGKWSLVDGSEFLSRITEDKYFIFEDFYNSLDDQEKEKPYIGYTRFEDLDKNYNDDMKKVKKDVRYRLYDGRKMVIDLRKRHNLPKTINL